MLEGNPNGQCSIGNLSSLDQRWRGVDRNHRNRHVCREGGGYGSSSPILRHYGDRHTSTTYRRDEEYIAGRDGCDGHSLVRTAGRVGQRIAVRIGDDGGQIHLEGGTTQCQREIGYRCIHLGRCVSGHGDGDVEGGGYGSTSSILCHHGDRRTATGHGGYEKYVAGRDGCDGHSLVRTAGRIGQRIAIWILEYRTQIVFEGNPQGQLAVGDLVACCWRRIRRDVEGCRGRSAPPVLCDDGNGSCASSDRGHQKHVAQHMSCGDLRCGHRFVGTGGAVGQRISIGVREYKIQVVLKGDTHGEGHVGDRSPLDHGGWGVHGDRKRIDYEPVSPILSCNLNDGTASDACAVSGDHEQGTISGDGYDGHGIVGTGGGIGERVSIGILEHGVEIPLELPARRQHDVGDLSARAHDGRYISCHLYVKGGRNRCITGIPRLNRNGRESSGYGSDG